MVQRMCQKKIVAFQLDDPRNDGGTVILTVKIIWRETLSTSD
jgi:hypothetical protein